MSDHAMFKKVLLAMDSSSAALELFNCIPDLKKMGLQDLLIVHAVNMESLRGEEISAYKERFTKRLEDKIKAIEQENIGVKLLITAGNPSEEIVKAADAENVDLILIGSIGESIIREIFLGSTVKELIRLSRKPVLVEKFITLGERTRRIPIFLQKWATVMLPTDFSESSEAVYQKFLDNAEKLHRVILLHVIEKGQTEQDIKKQTENAQKHLQTWEEKFKARGVDVEFKISTGVASQQINDIAEFEGVTMIAMPTRGLGYFANLLIGSTADAVVRRSSRPVLLFRGV